MRGSASVQDSILDAIGHTPMVRLPRGFDPQVRCEILLKCEFTNPGGSVKDRIALYMVREAERKGLLKPGGRIVECSSGNTGFGLCMVAAALGYRITIVIPDKMSREKIGALRALGGDVVVTPANVTVDHPQHYTQVAGRIARETGGWWPNQYHNPDNAWAHYYSTAPEIWEQVGGEMDAFVCGVGTGGTFTGIARYLKEQDPAVRCVGVDPPGSILYEYWKSGRIPEAQPYAVEGVGMEEVPGAWDKGLVDEFHVVEDSESFALARRLAATTGVFGGGSSGFALAGALRSARGLPADARVVVLLPDYGKAYLSKTFSEDWLRDRRFLPPTPAATATVADLVRDRERAHVSPNDLLSGAVLQIGERGVRPLPVVAPDGGLLGVLDEDAALRRLAAGEDLARLPVREHVVPAPPVLEPGAPWTAALAALGAREAVLVRHADGGFVPLDRRDLLQSLRRLSHR